MYTWGHGRHDELGHGDREQQTRPTRLDKTLFGRSPAVQEACGRDHTSVLLTAECGPAARIAADNWGMETRYSSWC